MTATRSLLDRFTAKGTRAAQAVAAEIAARLRRALRPELPLPENVTRARRVLAHYEPLLSRTMSDTLLAVWVAGMHEVWQELEGYSDGEGDAVHLSWSVVPGWSDPGGKKKHWHNKETGESRYQIIEPGSRKSAQGKPKEQSSPVGRPKSKASKSAARKVAGKPSAGKRSAADQKTLAGLADASKSELADPAHPMNARKTDLVEAKFGDGPAVKTIRSTQDRPLSAIEHDQMARAHARVGTILRLNGKDAEAQSQYAAAQYHRALAERKSAASKKAAAPEKTKEFSEQQHKDLSASHWQHMNGLGETEKAGVSVYSSVAHKQMNAVALGDAEASPDIKEAMRGLDDAIASAPPLTEPTTVYRGLQVPKDELGKYLANFNAAATSGKPVSMPTYTSTSIDPKVAAHFSGGDDFDSVQIEIAANKGLYISAQSADGDPSKSFASSGAKEREFLLARDSKFRVKGIKRKLYPKSDGSGGFVEKSVVELEQL